MSSYSLGAWLGRGLGLLVLAAIVLKIVQATRRARANPQEPRDK